MLTPLNILRATVLPLLVLLGVITILTYTKFRTFIDYANQAEHARDVMVNLANALESITEAETNQRGFLVTNDRSFLKPYGESLAQFDIYVNRIDSLIADDDYHSSTDIDSLRKLGALRQRLLANIVVLREQNEPLPIDSFYLGHSAMQRLHAQVDRMAAIERNALDTAVHETRSLIYVTPVLMLVLSLLTIGILLIGYIFFARELRMRLSAQVQLESKVEELNRSNRELEQYAFVASHDLQEPLRKIQAFGDRLMVRHGEAMNDEMRQNISKMQNAAARMQVLIDDLLNYSRSMHSKDDSRAVDLNKIVTSVLSDLDAGILNKGAQVHTTTLPTVQAVPAQMHQLFLNLISNAIKFSKPSVPPVIRIAYDEIPGNALSDISTTGRATRYHRISVTDNGIGFNKEYSKKIFAIFQQLHNKMQYGGTGIGLAVCKKIVENHRGHIMAQSEPGRGSTFIIFLPV